MLPVKHSVSNLLACMQATRKSGRDRGKRPRYAEPGMSSSDDDAIEIYDSDGDEPTQKLPKLSQRETPSQNRRKRSVQATSAVLESGSADCNHLLHWA